MEFIDPELSYKYSKLLDVKVKEYDKNLNEVTDITDDDYDPILINALLEYCKSYNNSFDTYETKIYKKANELGICSKLIYMDIDDEIRYIYDHPSFKEEGRMIYNFTELNNLFSDMSLSISFDEFIEGSIWESEGAPSEIIIRNYSKYNKNFDASDYILENWQKKLENWIKEDEKKLEEIYSRQIDLLFSSIHPEINSNFKKMQFTVINRVLSFNVKESSLSNTFASIYDKFIFADPNERIPFIKLMLNDGSETYKLNTQVGRTDINEWLNKDEKIEEESPFIGEDYIYFLIKFENSSFMECYLSLNKLEVKVPSSFNINVIEKLIQEEILNIFEVEIFDRRERNVEIETFLSNFPHIEPIYLQFYLVNNLDSSLYIKESNYPRYSINKEQQKYFSKTYGGREISSKTRKVRIFYKPVSDIKQQEQLIEYETSNTRKIVVKGINENDCIKFFVNIFGRVINGFFNRQNAINVAFSTIIFEEEFIEKKAKKDSKKKKKSSVLDAHLYTKKSKIEYLKSIIDLTSDYSRGCQCERQPIILSDEEVEAWLESGATIYDKLDAKKIRPNVERYALTDGRVINFTCPNAEYPEIHRVKQTKGGKPNGYELYPCCWSKKWKEELSSSDIIINTKKILEINASKAVRGNTLAGENKTIASKRIKDYNLSNIDESMENEKAMKSTSSIFMSQELKNLIIFLNGSKEEKIEVIKPSTKISKNSFLEAVLLGLKDKKYLSYEYRSIIHDAINPMTVCQEALGIDETPERIMEYFKDPKLFLDSSLHYRVLEEYFKIHIFVFINIESDSIKTHNIEYNFELEAPSHKIFPIRTLYHDRPSILLMKSGNEYNLISHDKEGTFNEEMTIKMMDLFNYTYNIYSENNNKSITKNIYSRVNWEYFFEGNPIKYQEIDIAGKTRIVQLESGLTISIPPTQPFNVPLIPEYYNFDTDDIIEIFGQPSGWDERGLWYPVMGIPNMFYVLSGPHKLGKMNEMSEIPLNTFNPTIDKYKEISDYRNTKKSVFVLIQIIQWAWRIDSRPIPFNSWFDSHISKIRKPDSIIEMLPRFIHITLPESKNSREAFSNISKWWPVMFTPRGKINLWDTLINKIKLFFIREEEIMGETIDDPIQNRLISIYENAEDLPVFSSTTRIFMNKEKFNTWARVDRSREENPEIKIINTFSDKCINDIISKDIPVRVAYKNHYIIVHNIKDKTSELAAIEASYYWLLYNKPLGNNKFKSPSKNKCQIVTLSFSKKYQLVEIEATDPAENVIYILKYPDGNYAAVYS